MNIWIFIVLFFLILAMITLINYKINNEFKIESSWLALSLAPVIIWLLATQQLSEFSGFGLAFKLKEATSTAVSLQIDGSAIKPKMITKDKKGGPKEVESFKRNRVEALTLELGKKDYYLNNMIKYYLEELNPYSFFKYVLFVSKSGEFRGMILGTKLLDELRSGGIDLVKLIESSNISGINGIITNSVVTGSTKQVSLQLMDSHGLSEMPVVDEFDSFIGVVERDKITSSIVSQLVSSPNK